MIEFLEPRIVPSGLIDVALVKGSLFLKSVTGDAGDEVATIARIGESGIQITPGSGVGIRFEGTINPPGQPLLLTGFNGQLSAALGGGNDALTLEGGTYNDVRIDLGDAGTTGGTHLRTNHFIANGVTFSKSLTYIGGNGRDVVEIKGATSSVAGALKISLGGGANQLLLTSADFRAESGATVRAGSGDDLLLFTGAKLTVVGNLLIASGAGSDTVQFTSGIAELSVSKSLTIASSGSRSVAVEQSITGLGKITIGGGLSLSAGTGDRVLQSVSGTIGTLSIGGDIVLSATNPTIHTQLFATSDEATLGGSLHMKSRGLTANQALSATGSEPATLSGSATLTGGTNVSVSYAGTLSKSLAITTSAGRSANVSIGAENLEGDLRVTTRDGFERTANVELRDLTVKGGIVLTSGIGASTLRVNQLDVAKTFTAGLGAGTNRFLIEQDGQSGNTIFRGAVALNGGSGADDFLIGKTGSDAVQFLATVIANGRAGTDTLTEGEASTHPAGNPLVKVSIP